MSSHPWFFTRLGGFDQARMESAADFLNLESLDQKLWAALACPVKGLAFPEKTLALLDEDNDGRIRAPELIAAVAWCKGVLTKLDALAKGGQPVTLAHINQDSEEGQGILSAAQGVLTELDKADATSISVDDISKASETLANAKFNGDGVVPVASADVESIGALITEIIGCLEGVDDRSGQAGVDQAKVDAFYDQAQAHVTWATGDADARTLGDGTEAAADAVAAVKAKVDDYFARCRLAAYDPRAITALNRKEEEYLAIAAEDLSVTADEVSSFPLAQVAAGGSLPLSIGVNPAWAGAMAALKSAAVAPIIGDQDTISESEWNDIQGKVAAFEGWRSGKPESAVESLGLDRLKEIIGGDGQAALTTLIAQDAAVAPKVASVASVEKLVRYHHDLQELSRNFINFTDFYSDTARATFEAGTLYLDGRACELVVRVDDAAKHGALAGRSKLFLAYCACTRPSGEKLQIAAAFTDGDSDFLMVGRNGVFYDRDGKDWDATITKIVDNPISLRQAFWAPYKAIVKFFEEQAAKRAEAKAAAADKKTMAAAADTATTPGEAPKAPTVDIGTVAAIAVGLGALGSMMVALIGYITGLFSLPFWLIVIIVAAIFISISMPSVVMAWFKLRQRSLGPILDSNGWAVNGRANVSVRFGGTLTQVAKLPKGAKVDAKDKYADPVNPWPTIIKLVVFVAFTISLLNWFGVIYELSDGMIGTQASTMKLVPEEPAADQAAAPGAAAPAAAPKAP